MSEPAVPSTTWTEVIAPDETERFDRMASLMAGIQKERATRHPNGRALHYKAHAGLLASFTVAEGLPAWTRVGIFATPQTLPAYLRMSSGSGANLPDGEPDIRGFALKVVGVPGKKLIPPLADAVTQDFLAIHLESVPFRTPDQFVGLVRAMVGPRWLTLPRLVRLFGLRTPALLRSLQAAISRPVGSMAELTMFSALPVKWGEHAVKYRFVPRHTLPQVAPASPDAKDAAARDRLSKALATWVAEHSLRYEMQVQGYIDADRTPIEDNTRPWDAPWVTVASLDVPVQDPSSERGKRVAAYVESLSFDPWHAPEAFRPLGAMMRARSPAYRDSVIARSAAPEPDGTEHWGSEHR